MTDYLFVYGTLRKDYDLKLKNKVSADLQYVGQGRVGASMYDIGRYPGAVRSTAGDEVIGDVFEVIDPVRVLKILDKYEGIPGNGGPTEFIRKRSKIRLRGGKAVMAWVYWYNFDLGKKLKIKYKNYLTYIKKKK
ncbi:MAG TPA: gamma-glutamylcyclotransferase family protein [Puia sp.]|nr:gamma-glutamylcyclotransferase family protein [Puia sp.]